MAYAVTDDNVKLYYEETGSGVPVIFVHEFAGDHRSWEPQVRHFGKRYRAITFAARGFAPSDVPANASSYSQARAADDIASVLDHLAIPAAHIVGLSMGGFATLHFGFRHPKRAKSLCVAGCGYGAEPDQQARFKDEADVVAASIQAGGMAAFAERFAIPVVQHRPRYFSLPSSHPMNLGFDPSRHAVYAFLPDTHRALIYADRG